MKDEYFLTKHLPNVAKRLTRACLNVFEEHPPRVGYLEHTLSVTYFEDFLRMKCDLYSSAHRFKICFIAPGAPFDSVTMVLGTDVGIFVLEAVEDPSDCKKTRAAPSRRAKKLQTRQTRQRGELSRAQETSI